MNTTIDLVVFGTFGTPNGFTQSSLQRNKYRTFDLNTNAIGLFAKTRMYSIRKELFNGEKLISYSLYSYAKEKHSDRSGTFIGSNISFFNKIATETLTVNLLNELHKDLTSNDINISNDIIQVSHSNKLKVNKPKDFDKIDFHLMEIEAIDFTKYSNKSLVVYIEISSNKLAMLFKKSIQLLNVYDTIYFTDSNEIATFVHQKDIFKLALGENAFNREIKNFADEKKKKTQLFIVELEKEREKLELEKEKSVNKYNERIIQNKNLHENNRRRIEESEQDLSKLDQKYLDFGRHIDESINQLKSGCTIENVKKNYNENKRIFIDGLNQQKPSALINQIAQVIPDTEPRIIPMKHHAQNLHTIKHDRSHQDNKQSKTFKIVSLILFILWIGTVTYFMFFNGKNDGIYIDRYPKMKL